MVVIFKCTWKIGLFRKICPFILQINRFFWIFHHKFWLRWKRMPLISIVDHILETEWTAFSKPTRKRCKLIVNKLFFYMIESYQIWFLLFIGEWNTYKWCISFVFKSGYCEHLVKYFWRTLKCTINKPKIWFSQ